MIFDAEKIYLIKYSSFIIVSCSRLLNNKTIKSSFNYNTTHTTILSLKLLQVIYVMNVSRMTYSNITGNKMCHAEISDVPKSAFNITPIIIAK